jgi:hypothetical protein
MTFTQHISEARKIIEAMPKKMVEQAGEEALEFIGDYPLYGATSNIAYEDAILIAVVLGKDI